MIRKKTAWQKMAWQKTKNKTKYNKISKKSVTHKDRLFKIWVKSIPSKVNTQLKFKLESDWHLKISIRMESLIRFRFRLK
jgi:hypothetical protein